jgi:hypothetical protein
MATIINLSNAVNAPIKCKRGDTFLLKDIRFWSDSAKTVPLDITGYDFAMEVKDANDVVILSFTTPTNFNIHDTNELDIEMPADDMKVEPSPEGQPYVFDIEMTDTNDVVTTIIKGTFTIEQDVTNA